MIKVCAKMVPKSSPNADGEWIPLEIPAGMNSSDERESLETDTHFCVQVVHLEYEVWMEGYSCSGNHSGATFLGKFEGQTFAKACEKAVHENFGDDKEFEDYWYAEELSYWSCRLYDNEADARQSFG